VRINWFSRLPPDSGPAAALSGRLLPFLGGLAELQILVPGPGWDPRFDAIGPVAVARPGYLPWSLVNRAEASFFVLEDDGESAPLWMLSRRHRGIAILASPSLGSLWRGIPEDAAEDREEVSAHVRALSGLDAPGAVARFWRGEDGPPAGTVAMVSSRALAVVAAHGGASAAGPGVALALDPLAPGEAAAAEIAALASGAASMRAAAAADELLDRATREVLSWNGAEGGSVPRAAESHLTALRAGLRRAASRIVGHGRRR
jgi:hypothetical protein